MQQNKGHSGQSPNLLLLLGVGIIAIIAIVAIVSFSNTKSDEPIDNDVEVSNVYNINVIPNELITPLNHFANYTLDGNDSLCASSMDVSEADRDSVISYANAKYALSEFISDIIQNVYSNCFDIYNNIGVNLDV